MSTEGSLVSSSSSSDTAGDLSSQSAGAIISSSSSTMQTPNVTQFLSIKLTSNNYLLWHAQIMPLLHGYRLASYVDGTGAAPPELLQNGSPNPAFTDWFCQDQVVRSWINCSVSESILHQITRCKTAREAWDKLAVIYSTGAKTQVQQLRKQLKYLTRGSDSIDEYMRKAKSYFDQLCAVEEGSITEDNLVCDVLQGLGPEYRPFTRAIEARNQKIGFDELYALLLSEETQLKVDSLITNVAATVPPTAHFANSGRGSRGRGRYSRGRGRSNYWHNNSSTGRHSSSASLTCFNCNGTGHVSRQCPSPKNTPHAHAATTDADLSNAWMVDSGANYHLTSTPETIARPTPVTDGTTLTIADGNTLSLSSRGSSVSSINGRNFHFKDILYSPSLTNNLLSVSAFTAHNNASIEFFPDKYFVKDILTKQVLYQGPSRNGLYLFPMAQVRSFQPKAFPATISLWHERLGHANVRLVYDVLRKNNISFDSNKKFQFCHACNVSKSHKLPFSESNYCAKQPLELVCSDVWGPAPFLSNDGYRYYVLFYDHFSKYSWLYFLKQKSEVLSVFIQFRTHVEKYFGVPIKNFQSDWGGEYRSLTTYLKQHGITQRVSCPHTPEQNGCAERKHRHLVELGRSLLNHASVPYKYWPYAFSTAVYTINRLPSSLLQGKTPFECLFHESPNYDELRVFGSLCYPWLKPYSPHKLAPKSSSCVFLGYSKLHKGYTCLEVSSGRIFISRHVLFFEQVFPFKTLNDNLSLTKAADSPTSIPLPPVPNMLHSQAGILGKSPIDGTVFCPNLNYSTLQQHFDQERSNTATGFELLSNSAPHTPIRSVSLNADQTEVGSTPIASSPVVPLNTNQAELISFRRTDSLPSPTTTRTVSLNPSPNPLSQPASVLELQSHEPAPLPIKTHTMVTRKQTGNLKPQQPWSPQSHHACVPDFVPTSYTQAIKQSKWREAMIQELNALIQTGTWELVPRQQAQNVVGCKWVFRIKQRSDGSIERYKARLVAKGYHQRPGIDYFETFSPVVKPTTIRIVLSLAVSNDWLIKQLDVSNAFLHGDLDSEVYMEQPPGFCDQNKPDYVCRLRRSLYGLRQAPRQWYKRLNQALINHGFRVSPADSSLFHYVKNNVTLFALVYVDDIILTGTCSHTLNNIILSLQSEFMLKDLGSLEYFLGMEATKTTDGLLLTQQKYITDLLQKANMSECRGISTPAATKGTVTSLANQSFSDPTLYRSIVGGLQYLSLTRPEVCYSVHKVSQFLHSPTEDNWSSVKRILRYLKETSTHGLLITKSKSTNLNIYSDADWATDTTDRKSITGYAIFMGNNLVSWNSKKQQTVARSSTEAEYRAVGLAITEMVWIQALLRDINYHSPTIPNLWCDNIGATYLSVNPMFHARTKHLEVDFHFVRDKVHNKEVKVQFICSKDQLADILTKPLPRIRHQMLMHSLTIRSLPRLLELRGPDKDTCQRD